MGIRPPRFLYSSLDQPQISWPSANDILREEEHSSELILNEDESHHLRHVLRLQEGDQVEIFDLHHSQIYRGKFSRYRAGHAEVELYERQGATPSPRLHLLVGLIKSENCDLIVEKCTELGVSSVHFFAADRSQYTLKGEKVVSKLLRWQKIVHVALKQSYSTRVTAVSYSNSLKGALDERHQTSGFSDLRLIMLPPENGATTQALQPSKISSFFPAFQDLFPHPSVALQNLQKSADSYIIVGPEGGLTDAEVSFAKSLDYKPCFFCSNVLRAETAAIVSCGIIQSFFP